LLGKLGTMFRASCEGELLSKVIYFTLTILESLLDTEMMQRLENENFDIGISEFFDVCGFGIFKRIGIKKTIVIYTSGMRKLFFELE
jgi:hypothetical protein